MYQQQPQDGRQPVPGMHMQANITNMNQQMSMPMNQQSQQPGMQQNITGMPMVSNVHPGSGQIPRMSTIGPQHSLGSQGVTHQTDMNSGARPMINMQHSVTKTEVGMNLPTGNANTTMTRVPVSVQQPVKTEGQATPSQQHDHIVKFKQLLPQLKECLIELITVARHNFAANAALDNREKNINPSTIPRFDKALEQFYAICNMIEKHLMISYDQLAHTLYSMQYTPITANQMRDGTNPNVYNTYIDTVQQQLNYAKEIQNMLLETSDRIMKRQAILQPANPGAHKRQQF